MNHYYAKAGQAGDNNGNDKHSYSNVVYNITRQPWKNGCCGSFSTKFVMNCSMADL